MKQDKRDRRSLRTRRLINTATLELLFERQYDAITVQDILDRASIGRSTFYTHYFDKEDVLTSIAEEMLEVFALHFAQRKAGTGIIPALEIFRHVQENNRYFQAMLRGRTGEVLWETAQTALSKTIIQALTADAAAGQSPIVPLPLVAQYLAGSFLNLLKWWLQAEMPYTPEQMETFFQQLALPGVWTIVEKQDTIGEK